MILNFDNENAFLSNFFPSVITFQGITYPTVEHFFQAMKTLDLEERQTIARADTPGQAKRLGRKVKLDPCWEDIKDRVMALGIELKFEDPILREKLLQTAGQYLCEGNAWHDNYWGSCNCPKCRNIYGENALGKILMRLRADYMEEEG